MRYMKILGLLAVAAAAMMAFAASASADYVTTTTGGSAATPEIHAVNEGGHVSLANGIANIECSSTVQGQVESHGSGEAASGNLSTVSFTGCTNGWTTHIEVRGSWSILWISAENGTVYWTGGWFAFTRHTIFGTVECRYQTNNTHIGTLTGGNPATLKLEGKIPFQGGSGLCGEGASQMSGNYVTTSALYVAP